MYYYLLLVYLYPIISVIIRAIISVIIGSDVSNCLFLNFKTILIKGSFKLYNSETHLLIQSII